MHWFMIRCNANELKVLKWNSEEASIPGTRHYCGEAHAGIYISRWLEASCSPHDPISTVLRRVEEQEDRWDFTELAQRAQGSLK